MKTIPPVRPAMSASCVILCAVVSGAALRAADELASSEDTKTKVMTFGFSKRVAGESYHTMGLFPLRIPDWSRCYLRIRAADRKRPLFITGEGRRGGLAFSFAPEAIIGRGGFTVSCEGSFIAELSDYQVSPEAVGKDQAGAEWSRAPDKWRATIRRVHGVTARDKGDALRRFIERRHKAAVRDEPIPTAFLRAKVDVELRAPTGTVSLRGQAAEVVIKVKEAERFSVRHPYWDLSLSALLKVQGRQLGLKETGTGDLEILAVLGTVQWVPIAVRLEEVPDASDMRMGVGMEADTSGRDEAPGGSAEPDGLEPGEGRE